MAISSLLADTLKTGDKEDWPYYEFFIYAPLSINLMFSFAVVKPYLGLEPAFYSRFPSTNENATFTTALESYYGSASVVGFDVFLPDSLNIDASYVAPEDIPTTIFSAILEI